MGRIVLVRHARTDRSGVRYCGRTDVPLSREGEHEAERVATWLADVVLPPARVVASPARRAVVTAATIARSLKGDPEVDDRLHEADLGEADGLTFDELAVRWPDLARRLASGDARVDWPGGERRDDHVARVAAVRDDLMRIACAGDVVVVSHGLTIALLAEGLVDSGFGALAPAEAVILSRADREGAWGVAARWRPERPSRTIWDGGST